MKAPILFFVFFVLFLPLVVAQPGFSGSDNCQADDDCGEGQFCNQTFSCQNQIEVTGGHVTSYQACSDSDGGLNYAVKGEVKYLSETFIDKCSGDLLSEYYCENSIDYGPTQGLKKYDCLSENKGCRYGACVDVCIDTDGKDKYVKGKASYGNNSFDDFCIDETHVKEYYCDGIEDKLLDESIQCESGETCFDGKCALLATNPDTADKSHMLEILPNVRVAYTPMWLFGGILDPGHQFPGHFVYNSVDPVIYYSHIKEYTDKELYDPEEWRIITEYDDRLCVVNVRDSDASHNITANFQISGQTADGTQESAQKEVLCVKSRGDSYDEFKRLLAKDKTLANSDWLCYANFLSAKNMRTLKYTCSVDVKDDKGASVKAESKPTIVARYIYPAVRVNQEDVTTFIKESYNTYKRMSELKDTVDESIETPMLSSKVVYYDYNVPAKEGDFKSLFGSLDFGYYKNLVSGLGIKFDPNKLDRLIVVSDMLVNSYRGEDVSGFTFFNHPVVYLKTHLISSLSHELGHAKPVMLCDEYDASLWRAENIELLPLGGCPNKLPDLELKGQIDRRLSDQGWENSFEFDWMKQTLLYELVIENTSCETEGRVFLSPSSCGKEIEKRAKEEFGDKLKEISVNIFPKYPIGSEKEEDGIQIRYDLIPSVSGSVMNLGFFYPEVSHSHEKYCPLKEC